MHVKRSDMQDMVRIMADQEHFERKKKHYRGYKKGWERVYKKGKKVVEAR